MRDKKPQQERTEARRPPPFRECPHEGRRRSPGTLWRDGPGAVRSVEAVDQRQAEGVVGVLPARHGVGVVLGLHRGAQRQPVRPDGVVHAQIVVDDRIAFGGDDVRVIGEEDAFVEPGGKVR